MEGRLNGGFFALPVWGAYMWRLLIYGGANFWKFTVHNTTGNACYTTAYGGPVLLTRNDRSCLTVKALLGVYEPPIRRKLLLANSGANVKSHMTHDVKIILLIQDGRR